MTSMIHKMVDRRRERRQRYKKYIDVFRTRFKCTAGEVMSRIEGAIRAAEAEARSWKGRAEALEARMVEAEARHRLQVDELTSKLSTWREAERGVEE